MNDSKGHEKKYQPIDNIELVMLHEFALILNSTHNIEQIIRESVGKIQMISRSDGCHILFKRTVSNRLKLETAIQVGEQQIVTDMDMDKAGVIKSIFRSGEIVIIPDTEKDPRIISSLRKQLGHKSMAAVPIKVKGEVIGVVVVFSKIKGKYSNEDGQFLAMLANHLGLAVENANLVLELEKAAIIDQLTGVYNYRYLKLQLCSILDEKTDAPVSFIIIDLNDFKFINDSLGHLAGDYILREFASTLKLNIRADDIIVRYGGDEFVVILFGADAEVSDKIANCLAENIKNKVFNFEGHKLNISFSWGAITTSGKEISCVNDIIKLADKRLYEMKKDIKSKKKELKGNPVWSN